jgi:hypothetical protein
MFNAAIDLYWRRNFTEIESLPFERRTEIIPIISEILNLGFKIIKTPLTYVGMPEPPVPLPLKTLGMLRISGENAIFFIADRCYEAGTAIKRDHKKVKIEGPHYFF